MVGQDNLASNYFTDLVPVHRCSFFSLIILSLGCTSLLPRRLILPLSPLALHAHAHWRTPPAATRHSVIGAVEGGARATSVKQISARRQPRNRVSRLIAAATASSFIAPQTFLSSDAPRFGPVPPVPLMPVGQSAQAQSAIPPPTTTFPPPYL